MHLINAFAIMSLQPMYTQQLENKNVRVHATISTSDDKMASSAILSVLSFNIKYYLNKLTLVYMTETNDYVSLLIDSLRVK